MATVFIIPGFRESAATKGYKEVASLFRKKGYRTVILPVHWNNRTISDYVSQARRIVEKESDVILFGFSFGAIVAACLASAPKVRHLFLCSLSPYFTEDLDDIPIAWKRFVGKRRVADFSKLSFAKTAAGIRCPTCICIGEKEAKLFPSLKKRAIQAAKHIKNSSLAVIPDAMHDIADPAYQKALEAIIKVLK